MLDIDHVTNVKYGHYIDVVEVKHQPTWLQRLKGCRYPKFVQYDYNVESRYWVYPGGVPCGFWLTRKLNRMLLEYTAFSLARELKKEQEKHG